MALDVSEGNVQDLLGKHLLGNSFEFSGLPVFIGQRPVKVQSHLHALHEMRITSGLKRGKRSFNARQSRLSLGIRPISFNQTGKFSAAQMIHFSKKTPLVVVIVAVFLKNK